MSEVEARDGEDVKESEYDEIDDGEEDDADGEEDEDEDEEDDEDEDEDEQDGAEQEEEDPGGFIVKGDASMLGPSGLTDNVEVACGIITAASPVEFAVRSRSTPVSIWLCGSGGVQKKAVSLQ